MSGLELLVQLGVIVVILGGAWLASTILKRA